MEHHADAGLARAQATVGAAPGCLGHAEYARCKDGLGGGGSLQATAMVGAEMVAEVLDRPARMAGSVQLEHPFDPAWRKARGASGSPCREPWPIEESVQAIVLEGGAGNGGSSARSCEACSAASRRRVASCLEHELHTSAF